MVLNLGSLQIEESLLLEKCSLDTNLKKFIKLCIKARFKRLMSAYFNKNVNFCIRRTATSTF